MRNFLKKTALVAIALLFTTSASAQLIYGNTFPFWNVNGPLAVTGLSTLSGGLTLTGTTTIGAGATLASPTITGATLTTAGLTSPAITTSITTPSTSFTAFAGATTLFTVGGTGASASSFFPSTLDATSSITGAIRTSGGLSAAKAANIGTTLTVGTSLSVGTTSLHTGVATFTVSPVITTSETPAAAAACTAGTIAWGPDYLYVCTASGAWKRAAITGGY